MKQADQKILNKLDEILVSQSANAEGTAWGNIPGTLSNQADLSNALAAKAPLVSPAFTTPNIGAATGTSLNFPNANVVDWGDGSAFIYGSGAADYVRIATAGADRVLINSDGNVNIPVSLTTSAINGGTAANDDITIQGTSNGTRDTSYVNLQPNGGNVGIGTTGGLSKLSINGGLHVGGESDAGDNNAIIDGTLTVSGLSTFSNVGAVQSFTGGTSATYQTFSTSGGNYYIGVSSSTGTGLISGNGNYGMSVLTESARNLSFGTNNTLALNIDGTTQAVTLTGALITTPSTLSGAGAISVTTPSTAFTSTGASQALTLADGTNGQIKTIVHTVDGGSGVLTPTTKTGWASATFTNAGDTLTLQFHTTVGWLVMSSYGTTVTP